MSIIFTAAYEAAEEAAERPMLNPRIGWDSLTREAVAGDVTASSSTGTGPSDSPLRPDTAEFWQPSSLPATWQLQWSPTQSIDYVGIAAHTIGSSDCTVVVETSEGPVGSPATEVWSPLARAYSPPGYLQLPGTSGNFASTPDSTANSITGDLDIRVRASANDWTPSSDMTFVAKHNSGGDQRSYMLRVIGAGNLQFLWNNTGLVGDNHSINSTVVTGISDGTTKWVRVTFDVNNGAAGNDVRFYTSDDYDPSDASGTWTQLGSTVTTAGIASNFDSTATLNIGAFENGGSGTPFAGKINYVELRNGIDGPVVASFDAADGETGDTSIISSQTGEIWTINRSGANPAALYVDGEANDKPLLFLDTARSAIKVRISIFGTVAPQIAVIYVGLSLWMPEAIRGAHSPLVLSRQTVMEQALSRGGQFLGQNIRRRGYTGSVHFENLDADWYRTNFDPFVQAARRYPYFFAWRPGEREDEVAYVWTGEDIAPSYMGFLDYVQVGWNMQALGDES